MEDVLAVKCTLIFIIVMIAAGIKIIVARIEPNMFSFSYRDFFEKRQWWRVLSSNVYHSTVTHLALDVLAFWHIRTVEGAYGSGYFLKYSLLLIVCQKVLQISLLHIVVSYWTQILPLVRSIETIGCSGLVFAWMGFVSVAPKAEFATTYLFDIFPFSSMYVPAIMIVIYEIFLPRKEHTIGCLTGVLCGVLLGLGILEVLSTWYWTACFVLNMTLVALLSLCALHEGASDRGNDLAVESLLYNAPPTAAAEGGEVRSSHSLLDERWMLSV